MGVVVRCLRVEVFQRLADEAPPVQGSDRGLRSLALRLLCLMLVRDSAVGFEVGGAHDVFESVWG